MQFEVKTADIINLKTELTIVGVFENGELGISARALDKTSGGAISDVLKHGDIKGNVGDLQLLTQTAGLPCKRVLLVGLGDRKKLDRKNFRKAVQGAFSWVTKKPYKEAASCLAQESVKGADAQRAARICAETWHTTSYRFTRMKSKGDKTPVSLSKLVFAARNAKQAAATRKGVAQGAALGQGMGLSRDLANLPGNVCTPSFLAAEAKKLAKNNKNLSCKVLDEAAMQKLGMGSLLSVSAGSAQPAKLIVLEYKGAAASKPPVALVGKGVTFDTGGISLKPPGTMDEMKFDMSGAASVFGTIKAIVELQPKINVVGIIPAVENMPGSSATKPGDIVTSMSGQTIEILNTDAEGRLILCDALTYARQFKPAAVVDIATLTGACVIALGSHNSGLLSSSDALAKKLQVAGDKADDPAWRLPLGEEYSKQLKSNFADFANIGGREAGTITAACFLEKFTDGLNWAHLDIAGTAYRGGAAKGSTGRPVPLLLEFLLNN